ncbi:hypothetical protein CTM93_13030 [Photobacterium phosphoreum]|uniref:PcfJ domain-containing protein n=1 Tax=Photobacterium phosphoreum TaxID=659 RepID=UPI000D1847D5|nr:PcfJ domain-containing protein [Photobacterium phosphoreum]PSU82512.1 hypothetical protein CTM93_13030 [Photobacterium phosphoreum]
MFDGLTVIPFKKKTIVLLRPLLNISFVFRNCNGFVFVDRVENDAIERNVYDIGLPIISLSGTCDFLWVEKLLPTYQLDIIRRIEFKQIPLLNALNASKELSELFDSAPTLAWLIVCFLDYEYSTHYLNHLGLCKRRDVLTKITKLNCNGKHVKFINKIELESGSEATALLILKSISNDEIIDSFRHRFSIKSSELYLIDVYPFLVGSNLLPELVERKYQHLGELTVGLSELLSIYQDTINLGQALNFKDSKTIVATCDDKCQLYKLHAQWIDLLNKSHLYLDKDIPFEPFPYTDCLQFQHLSSVNKLIEEGCIMKHCVATYRDKILKNKSILFRVNYPERATLEIGFGGGEYFMKQLKLIQNGEPSNQTYTSVNDWIKRVNKKLIINFDKVG